MGKLKDSKDLTREMVMEVLRYDDSGSLVWARDIGPNRVSGLVAGNVTPKGYLQFKCFGRNYLAHRIVWLYHYGSFPEFEIDHINGIRADNRIENLRHAKREENCRNTKIRVDNKTGIKGVYLHAEGIYVGKVQSNNNVKKKYFRDIDAAKVWVSKQREILHGEYANAGNNHP